MLHVAADHITLDLHAKRYVAVGNVTVVPSDAAAPAAARVPVRGDIFGEDIDAQRGLLVSLDAPPTRRVTQGGAFRDETVGLPAGEPLALPDFGEEAPFASAVRAVAHLGADVRLTNAKVLVPGSKSIPLPSYVYTYSSDPGYAVNNLNASEDLPVYVGSTRDSVQGIHFYYRPDVKVALGFDERIVDGPKAYLLGSLAPVIGRSKALNLTWQEQINGHAQQSVAANTLQDFGTFYSYDVRDGIHHSYLEFNANAAPQQNWNGVFAWQGYNQTIARRGPLSHLFFFLRSEYGFLHTPLESGFSPFPSTIVLPQLVQHVAGEAYLATQPLALGPSTTAYASADDRFTHDTLPHLQSTQIYSLTLSQRANRLVTLNASVADQPIHDGYPTLNASFATHIDTESATFSYNHERYFALTVSGTHGTASTQLPAGFIVTPWSLFADVRFRVAPTLSLEFSRSYFFGFEGQRFGAIGFQIFP